MTLCKPNHGEEERNVDGSADCLIARKLKQGVAQTEDGLRLVLFFRHHRDGAGEGVLQSLLPVPVDGDVDDCVKDELADGSGVDVVERLLHLPSALHLATQHTYPFLVGGDDLCEDIGDDA